MARWEWFLIGLVLAFAAWRYKQECVSPVLLGQGNIGLRTGGQRPYSGPQVATMPAEQQPTGPGIFQLWGGGA